MNDLAGETLDRLGLLSADAATYTADALSRIEADGVETVRFLFADQHGVLRGKALTRSAAASAFRNGVTAPSSLMLKDTSSRTVFPVWQSDAGFGEGVMTGAGDMLLVPDALTLRRLPWSPHSAWVLCDVVQADGAEIPFASRTVLKKAEDSLAKHGLKLIVGLEVEFHVFRVIDTTLNHTNGGMPGSPPETAPLNQGYQLLSETAYAASESLLDDLRRNAVAMGLPIRSIEVEFGPSQFEVTFDPAAASEHADNMVLFRTMVKEICQRAGLHATFMCRPVLPHAAASGWHVHQSLVDRATGANRFTPKGSELTPEAANWIAGLLHHAAESCLLTTPSVNAYKRYQPNQLAPDRIQWGRDNKGAMLRALLSSGDAASRIENRVPEPAANPYYLFASQILSGVSGIEQDLRPPPAVETPYSTQATALPANLGGAIDAFAGGQLYADTMGTPFVQFMTALKQAEWARYLSDLSEWEHREYFQLF